MAKSKTIINKPIVQKMDDPKLVYYGPYPCKDTLVNRKMDNTGCDARIVKAGNGAHPSLEFDYPAEGWAYPNTEYTPHICAEHKK